MSGTNLYLMKGKKNMPPVEKLIDRQLEIIKELFRIHSKAIKSITDAISYNAEHDIKYVDSEVLLRICRESVTDVKNISDNL
jgi:hypothetical protein